MKRFVWLAAAGHILLLAGIVAGLVVARHNALSTFDTPDAQRDWQHWRDAAAAQDKESAPVHREVPRSAEPPSLVLLRDYFVTCVATSLVLSSALYWTFVLFIRGAAYGPQFEIGKDDVKPGRLRSKSPAKK